MTKTTPFTWSLPEEMVRMVKKTLGNITDINRDSRPVLRRVERGGVVLGASRVDNSVIAATNSPEA